MSKRVHELGANDKVALDTDIPSGHTVYLVIDCDDSSGNENATLSVNDNSIQVKVSAGIDTMRTITVMTGANSESTRIPSGGGGVITLTGVEKLKVTEKYVGDKDAYIKIGEDEYLLNEEAIITGTTAVRFIVSKCLVGETMVTMADGSERRIDSLHAGDRVLAYDADTNELVADELVFSDADDVKTHNITDVWDFENGFFVKTVHDHELYCVESGGMKYMRDWKIGEHAVTLDGKHVALVSHRQEFGEVRHYKITGHHHNFFVNGLLNGDRESKVCFPLGK